jgi:ATP-dependent helicase/nuclease subunit B
MPGRRMCFGSSFTALRDYALDWLDDHTDNTPESARFLENNSYQREAIADAWKSTYNPLRLSVTEFDTFGLTIHERLFGPYPDVGTLERRRMIEHALAALEDESALEKPRHHTPSLSELFRELEADNVQDSETLDSRLSDAELTEEQRSVVIQAFERYVDLRSTIAHPDAMPRNEKLAAVADTEQSLTDVFPHLDAIAVSGLIDPSRVELAVLDRIAEEFPVLVILPTPDPVNPSAGVGSVLEETLERFRSLGFDEEHLADQEPPPLCEIATQLYDRVDGSETPPPELSWYEAPTPDREVRHLARRLRDRLATEEGCSPDDLLVLAPGLLSYRDGIADVFEAYGIDHAYRVSILLERTYAGRAVLDAIELCEQPRADGLAQLAANPLVDLSGVDRTELADVQRRLYTTSIDAFTAELNQSKTGVETFLTQVDAVREADAKEIIPAVQELLTHLDLEATIDDLDESGSINAGYEARALNQVEEILESVSTVCEELDPDEPLSEVATALEGVRVPSPTQVTDNHVEIIGLQDVPMADFEDLYVLGATANHLSGSETRPRFFQDIGEKLGLYERYAKRNLDRYRFATVLANAKTVHITTPETTIDDEPLLVSPFVDELARITGLEPTTGSNGEQRGAREDLQRAIAGASPDKLDPALNTARDRGQVSNAFVTAASRGALCGANRSVSSLTAHDGQLPAESIAALDDKLTSTPYSHSRLSRYAKCGFKYLLRAGWRLEKEDDIEPGIDPRVFGLIVHRTAESFYRELQSGGDGTINITQIDRAVLDQRLLEAADDAIDEADTPPQDVFVEKMYRALLSGLGTPATNDYYYPPEGQGEGDIAGTLVQFLEKELELVNEAHRPSFFEAHIGDGNGVSLTDGRTLPVGGIVDRVDLTPEGATVFDYKASSIRGARSRENNARDGMDFQLPIYSLGTPTLIDDDISPIDVTARYYVMNGDPEVTVRPGLRDRFDDIDYDSFLLDVIPDRLQAIVESIETGAFQPAYVGEKTAQCQYCEFSDVCDVRHHRRYDVIERIDDADHPAYVPDGVRPTETLDLLPTGDDDE